MRNLHTLRRNQWLKKSNVQVCPVVHICTVTPISMTVGANRIVPAIAIPHPLGNPALTMEEEKVIRRKIVETALEALETEVDDQTIFDVKY